MTKKIFQSILQSSLLILVIALALVMAVLNRYFVDLEFDTLAAEAQMTAEGIELNGLDYLEGLDSTSYRLTWVAEDGTVLYDNQADAAAMENHGSREEIIEALQTGTGKAERSSDTLGVKTLYYARRLSDRSVIRVAVDRDTILVMLVKMVSPLLWILLAAVILASMVARRAAEKIVAPLNEMNLEHPLDKVQYDEIRPLLTRIDHQNRQIDEQMDLLEQKRQEFQQITAGIQEGLIILNSRDEVLSINPAALNLLDSTVTGEGQNIRTVCRDQHLIELLDTAKEKNSAEDLLEIGGRVLKVSISRIHSADNVDGMDILIVDNTADYQAEQQRREFTANVSHELKTPLQSIMGSAELLQNHLVPADQEDVFLSRIQKEAARLLTLIEDIIRLSQLDENNELPREAVNLKDTVRETLEGLQGRAEKAQVTVNQHLEDAWIMAMPRLAYEIVYNLVDNAIRYNRSGGSVDITTRIVGQKAELIVTDTGIGIPKKNLSRIFERFYRVDKSHSRATGGTGLGLSIVKHAVQKCSGTIRVESQEGKGSTFTVTFPAIEHYQKKTTA